MKRKGPRRDINKELFWRGILREHRQSAENIRDFCRKKGLTEPSFYAWRREIKRRGSAKGGRIAKASRPNPARMVRLSASKPVKRRTIAAAFLPVRISNGITVPPSTASVECHLPSGAVLRLPAAMEAVNIAAIVHAWEQGPC
jgi:transposase-like protein